METAITAGHRRDPGPPGTLGDPAKGAVDVVGDQPQALEPKNGGDRLVDAARVLEARLRVGEEVQRERSIRAFAWAR